MTDIYGSPAVQFEYVNCPNCRARIRIDLLPEHLRECRPEEPLP